jgi:hypothetical protein
MGEVEETLFFPTSFPGDFNDKYTDEGPGTYNTVNPGNSAVWIKE